MTNSWETTVEDVEQVLEAHNLDLDADDVHGQLDHDDIEDAALYADDMQQQTVNALQEIEHQLIKMNYLPEGTTTKFSPDGSVMHN